MNNLKNDDVKWPDKADQMKKHVKEASLSRGPDRETKKTCQVIPSQLFDLIQLLDQNDRFFEPTNFDCVCDAGS